MNLKHMKKFRWNHLFTIWTKYDILNLSEFNFKIITSKRILLRSFNLFTLYQRLWLNRCDNCALNENETKCMCSHRETCNLMCLGCIICWNISIVPVRYICCCQRMPSQCYMLKTYHSTKNNHPLRFVF